jgi:hypothetical protein
MEPFSLDSQTFILISSPEKIVRKKELVHAVHKNPYFIMSYESLAVNSMKIIIYALINVNL